MSDTQVGAAWATSAPRTACASANLSKRGFRNFRGLGTDVMDDVASLICFPISASAASTSPFPDTTVSTAPSSSALSARSSSDCAQ